jgi:spermidine synthase
LIRWERLDTCPVPDAAGVVELWQRGAELAIRVDGRQLMSTREHGSEEALAELACDRIARRPEARVLVGGLGMGFTLAAALSRVGPEARVVVAELVPAVVRWNRGPLAEAAGAPLSDPRASVHEGDVADLLRSPPAPWDAVLLDVDNGPRGLTRASNDWLYSWQGLSAAFEAIAPGGVLGVWSAAPDPGFTRRVGRAGFAVEAIEVRSRGRKGGHRHIVWIGTRRSERPHARAADPRGITGTGAGGGPRGRR